MHRRLLGIVAAGLVLIVLVAAVSYLRAQSPETAPLPGATATSTPEAPGSNETQAPAAETSQPRLVSGPTPTAPETSSIAAKAVTPEATATLVVDGTRYPLTVPAGSTLKAAMDTLVAESDFTYGYRAHTGLGAFVTEINGRASDGDHYWILYVNGEQSSTGISSTRVRSGDLIEWRLDKSY